MTRPLAALYSHIHRALGGEMLKVEEQASGLDPSSRQSVDALAGHLAMVRSILDIHAREEERGAWPMIEAKLPGITQAYQLDHDQERDLFAVIDADFERLRAPAGPDAQAVGRRLYRNIVALTSHLIHHMNKEELHPYAAFVETLSPEEEIGIVTSVLQNIPDQTLAVAMPWQAGFLSDEELLDDIDIYLKVLGQEKQTAFIAPLARGLPSDRWQKLVQGQPKLASFTA